MQPCDRGKRIKREPSASGLSEAPASAWEAEDVGSRKPKGGRGVRALRAKWGAGVLALGVGAGRAPR